MMIRRRQRRNIVRCTLFALIFSQSLNRVQRGLSAIAELLVSTRRLRCLNSCTSLDICAEMQTSRSDSVISHSTGSPYGLELVCHLPYAIIAPRWARSGRVENLSSRTVMSITRRRCDVSVILAPFTIYCDDLLAYCFHISKNTPQTTGESLWL